MRAVTCMNVCCCVSFARTTGNIKIIYCLKVWPFIHFYISLSLCLALFFGWCSVRFVRQCQLIWSVSMPDRSTVWSVDTIRSSTRVCGWSRQYGCQFMVMSKQKASAFHPHGPCEMVHESCNCYLMLNCESVVFISFIYVNKTYFAIWIPSDFRSGRFPLIAHERKKKNEITNTHINYKEIMCAWASFFCDLLHPLS